MTSKGFDRSRLIQSPLAERKNRIHVDRDLVSPDDAPASISDSASAVVAETAERLISARRENRPRMLAFGAHTIKNGLGPVLIQLMETGWLTHLATNGAGIIHDWELSYLGMTSEDVKENLKHGQFGIWEETGYYLNLAIAIGAYNGLGYGESVGSLIDGEGLNVPTEDELLRHAQEDLSENLERAAAAADLLDLIRRLDVPAGRISIPHPFKKYSAQAAANRLHIPFTAHPMIGHDIIYTHPMNQGAAIGRTSLRDFLSFAEAVSNIEGGVYMSVGSAVMSPMVFEKSFSMAQNLALQEKNSLDNVFLCVVDLAPFTWDWGKDGEPPDDNPAYYQRYCKTFSRIGRTMRYACADNRDFLLSLYQRLRA